MHAGAAHMHVVAPNAMRQDPATQRKRPKYTRSKTGCLTCRAKKIKVSSLRWPASSYPLTSHQVRRDQAHLCALQPRSARGTSAFLRRVAASCLTFRDASSAPGPKVSRRAKSLLPGGSPPPPLTVSRRDPRRQDRQVSPRPPLLPLAAPLRPDVESPWRWAFLPWSHVVPGSLSSSPVSEHPFTRFIAAILTSTYHSQLMIAAALRTSLLARRLCWTIFNEALQCGPSLYLVSRIPYAL